jgi:hypothetical protein
MLTHFFAPRFWLLLFAVASLVVRSATPTCMMHGGGTSASERAHSGHGTPNHTDDPGTRCQCVGACQPGGALVAEASWRASSPEAHKTRQLPLVGLRHGSVPGQVRLPLATAPPGV